MSKNSDGVQEKKNLWNFWLYNTLVMYSCNSNTTFWLDLFSLQIQEINKLVVLINIVCRKARSWLVFSFNRKKCSITDFLFHWDKINKRYIFFLSGSVCFVWTVLCFVASSVTEEHHAIRSSGLSPDPYYTESYDVT